MSKEAMAKEMLENRQKMQLDFTTELLEKIEWYKEKAEKTTYIPSFEEALQFEKMLNILDDMGNWFYEGTNISRIANTNVEIIKGSKL